MSTISEERLAVVRKLMEGKRLFEVTLVKRAWVLVAASSRTEAERSAEQLPDLDWDDPEAEHSFEKDAPGMDFANDIVEVPTGAMTRWLRPETEQVTLGEVLAVLDERKPEGGVP